MTLYDAMRALERLEQIPVRSQAENQELLAVAQQLRSELHQVDVRLAQAWDDGYAEAYAEFEDHELDDDYED